MVHVNTFLDGVLIAAYILGDDENVPSGRPIGRQGNAVLIKDGDIVHVISRPFDEGDILEVMPAAAGAAAANLSKYFR